METLPRTDERELFRDYIEDYNTGGGVQGRLWAGCRGRVGEAGSGLRYRQLIEKQPIAG